MRESTRMWTDYIQLNTGAGSCWDRRIKSKVVSRDAQWLIVCMEWLVQSDKKHMRQSVLKKSNVPICHEAWRKDIRNLSSYILLLMNTCVLKISKVNQKRKFQIWKRVTTRVNYKQFKPSVSIIITKLVHKLEVQSMQWEYLFAFWAFEFWTEMWNFVTLVSVVV